MGPEHVDDLLKTIYGLSGRKIVTFVVGNDSIIKMEFSSTDSPESHERKDAALREKIDDAFKDWGGMVIRQILPLKVQRTDENGVTRWVAKKNIYGVAFKKHSFSPLTSSEVEEAVRTDYETGNVSPRDNSVWYRELPVKISTVIAEQQKM